MHVLAVFGNGGGLFFMPRFTRLCKCPRVYSTYVCNPYHTGHIKRIDNYKQHTADLQLVALFFSHLAPVQLSGSQTQARLDGVV